MSGTHLFYNGVLMQDCEMHEMIQTFERDPTSSVDVLYSRWRISASSTVISLDGYLVDEVPIQLGEHPSTVQTIDSRVSGVSDFNQSDSSPEFCADRLRLIHALLQKPRGDFWLGVNGSTVVPNQSGVPGTSANDSFRPVLIAAGHEGGQVPGMGETELLVARDDVIDANNGPRPISVDVKRIFGGRAVRVSITIEVCRTIGHPVSEEEDPETPTPSPYPGGTKAEKCLSHRWSMVETIDANWNRSWQIESTAVAADHRYKGLLGKVLRLELFKPPYTKTTRLVRTVDATGLKLHTSWEFAQEGDAPPSGITSWEGTYTESSGLGGGNTVGAMVVRVKGPVVRPFVQSALGAIARQSAEQQKALLLRVGMAIVLSRISGISRHWKALPGQNAQTTLLKETVIVEQMGKPELEIRATVQYTPNADGAVNDFNLRLSNLGKPIQIASYDPQWWPSVSDSSSVGYSAIAAKIGESIEDWGSIYAGCPSQEAVDDWHGFRLTWIPPEDQAEDPYAKIAGSEYSLIQNDGQPAFTAYKVYSLDGSLQDIDLPPRFNFDGETEPTAEFGINTGGQNNPKAAVYQQGFTYVQWDSDVEYETCHGRIILPLSKRRTIGSGNSQQIQSSVIAQLHAPVAKRVYTVIATRAGAFPQIPLPLDRINDQNGYEEVLLSKKIIGQTPKLQSDNVTMIYGIEARWVYGLTRAPGDSTSPDSLDYLRMGSTPIDMALPVHNRLPLASLFDSTGALYNAQDPNRPQPD